MCSINLYSYYDGIWTFQQCLMSLKRIFSIINIPGLQLLSVPILITLPWLWGVRWSRSGSAGRRHIMCTVHKPHTRTVSCSCGNHGSSLFEWYEAERSINLIWLFKSIYSKVVKWLLLVIVWLWLLSEDNLFHEYK